jgi:hypothetical protein
MAISSESAQNDIRLIQVHEGTFLRDKHLVF